MTSPPIGTDEELIERLERKLASNGAWMTSDVRAFYEQLRDALQSRISEVERLTARVTELEAALKPFADRAAKLEDHHLKTYGRNMGDGWPINSNLGECRKARAALSQHRKV